MKSRINVEERPVPAFPARQSRKAVSGGIGPPDLNNTTRPVGLEVFFELTSLRLKKVKNSSFTMSCESVGLQWELLHAGFAFLCLGAAPPACSAAAAISARSLVARVDAG